MSLGPASDSSSARRRNTAVGVSRRAAARDRNLVPLSADFFVVAGGEDDVADDAASGMDAATSGFLAIAATSPGGVDVEGALSVIAGVSADVVLRGSFWDRFEAGEEGDKLAHAGSTLEVAAGTSGGGCVDAEVDGCCDNA